ncbi:DUF505 family protein [Archaeoglobus sp.]
MFLKKRHLEILKALAEKKFEIEKSSEDFKTRVVELFILGFVDFKDGELKLTQAGRKLEKVVEKLDVDRLPEIFADTEIVKIVQLGVETDYLPKGWIKKLEERQMITDGRINEIGREILSIYRTTHPLLYLTKEIIDFIDGMPKIGEFEELVAYKNTLGYGDNVINALQAMRMLIISPQTEGKAFTTTKALDLALRVAKYTSFEKPIVLKAKDVRLLKRGKGSEVLEEMGLWDGEVTDLGRSALETYEAIGIVEERLCPMYLLEDEIAVVNAVREIERINRHTPDILPTYAEIEKRVKVEDLGAILHLLESKELIERRLVKGKDTYWTTKWSYIVDYGTFTVDGVKALTYSTSGDVPIYEWVVKAKEENLVKGGITKKGRFVLDYIGDFDRKPYLTKFDIAILIKVPKRFVLKDDLIQLVMDYVGENEKEIVRAVSECEAKGWIEELQNKTVRLTKLGRAVKEAISYAKTRELLATKFAITPTTYRVLRVIYENLDVFNKIWKESGEIRNYKQDEVDFIKKKLSLSEDEIKKALTVLRVTGFVGKKSLTKAGRLLVRAYL